MSMLFRRIVNKLQRAAACPASLKYCTSLENGAKVEYAPIISKIRYDDESSFYQKPRQVWLENLNTIEEKKLGLVTLHPHIYATAPRIDIVHQNVRWQKMYRWVVSIWVHRIVGCIMIQLYMRHDLFTVLRPYKNTG